MIFLVVVRTSHDAALADAVQRAKAACDGFCFLAHGQDHNGLWVSTMLVHSPEEGPHAIRDRVGGTDVEVTVVRLQREWGAQGYADVAGWLEKVDALF